MYTWQLFRHYALKYKLAQQTQRKFADQSFQDGTVYNFPTYFDIRLISSSFTKSCLQRIQYLLHLLFISLILIDFIYTNIHSKSLLFSLSSSTPTVVILFIGSFVCCLLLNLFGFICHKTDAANHASAEVTKTKRTNLFAALLQSFLFILFLFTIITVVFYISAPLLLYLCVLAVIKLNPIQHVIQYLELHDIMNFKNIQMDYNFIPYNFITIDTNYNAIYQYLFAYILVNYESTPNAKETHQVAADQCLEKCHQLLSADYISSHMHYESEKDAFHEISFSHSVSQQRFVTQKYVQTHMSKDILLMSLVFVLVAIAFWICYYLTNDGFDHALYRFYAVSTVVYSSLFLSLIALYVINMEHMISEHMAWLKHLYLADHLDINRMHYVKFMHCFVDILSTAETINCIKCNLNHDKLAAIITNYVFDVQAAEDETSGKDWICELIQRHYSFKYYERKQQQLNSLQFNAEHWLTLKIKLLRVNELRYYQAAGDDKIYAKLKMIKAKYITHKMQQDGHDRNDLMYYGNNNETLSTDHVKGSEMNQEFLFSLKFSDVSITKFVITVIAECHDEFSRANEFDDIIGVTYIDVKDIFYDRDAQNASTKQAVTGSFDLYCKNEESGCVDIEFEIQPFNALYHINAYNESNYSLNNLMDDDDTVPLISVY